MPSHVKRSSLFQICVSVLVFAGLCACSANAQTLPVRFITFNVDFNNTTQQVRQDVQNSATRADIIIYQEAKFVTIDDFLNDDWDVYQVVDNGDARRGSAIAIRKSIMDARLAQGLRLGVDAAGVQMLDRYIAWMDIRLTNGRVFRVMSLHMPPARFDHLQPVMADNLVTFVGQTPHPVVVGGDWNYTVTDDPYNIGGRANMRPRGRGIDGFYYHESLVNFDSTERLTDLNVNSDHDPVLMTTTIDGLNSDVRDWNLY